MEVFFELILTFGLTLILTSFFVKIVAMQQPNNTDKDRLTEEAQNIDKFQSMPFREEVKLEECPSEGKSSVELYNIVGVSMEDRKFQDIAVVDSKEDETENYDDDDDDEGKVTSFRSEKINGEEGRLCEIEIEIESEEEDEEEIGIMDDWEEIGRKDFEELLVNKGRDVIQC